jgi:hypothetical protein
LQSFKNSKPTTWIPMDTSTEIIEKAARIFLPDDPSKAVMALGREAARYIFRGPYKIFLYIAKPSFVAERITQLWSAFYNNGTAQILNLTDHSATMVVTNFPEFNRVRREYTAGYVMTVLELTKVKNVQVKMDDKNSSEWKWLFFWDIA